MEQLEVLLLPWSHQQYGPFFSPFVHTPCSLVPIIHSDTISIFYYPCWPLLPPSLSLLNLPALQGSALFLAFSIKTARGHGVSVTGLPGKSPSIILNCMCTVLSCSVVSDSATPWTVAHQAPLSMGFSRQEYWSG